MEAAAKEEPQEGVMGWREGRQRQPSVLPGTFLASSESLAFKNFTEEKSVAPGRRLRSRCAARGVGSRHSPAGADAGVPSAPVPHRSG